jgi:hypothetical protein
MLIGSALLVGPASGALAASVFLIQNDGKGIKDSDFAQIMGGKLISGGNSNVLDAKFLFQECYGGGMLGPLGTALGDKVKWVGGSASSATERSGGQVTKAENTPLKVDPKAESANPLDFWTKALLPELPKDQALLNGIKTAIANDALGPNGTFSKNYEHGQSASANGGDAVKLVDPNAKSYHAILWAGMTNRQRFSNDIGMMRQALVKAWGDPAKNKNVTIDILFGKGTAKFGGQTSLPATLDQLTKTVNGLDLNKNEEFLFYASDHGGTGKTIQAKSAPPKPVGPDKNDVESFNLSKTELNDIKFNEDTAPVLTVDYSGVQTAGVDSVSLNGVPLGYLDPGQTQMDFTIPVGALSLSDSVVIASQDISSFDVTGKDFFSGAINSDPTQPVPEPSSFVILATGLMSLLAIGRRRAVSFSTAVTRFARPNWPNSIICFSRDGATGPY